MTTTPRRRRSIRRPDRATFYPEEDGQPMGATPIHRDVIIRSFQILQDRYAARDDVYVSSDMMCYYVEGNPYRSICPDVFVTFGAPKLPERRVYKLWEEGPFDVVLETTSVSTRKVDTETKRERYQSLGVREYFLFDPLGEYLHPRLRGFRLVDGIYQELVPSDGGALISEVLGLRLIPSGETLRLWDIATDTEALPPSERAAEAIVRARVEGARAEAESARAEAEAGARRAADARIAELEALLAQRAAEDSA